MLGAGVARLGPHLGRGDVVRGEALLDVDAAALLVPVTLEGRKSQQDSLWAGGSKRP